MNATKRIENDFVLPPDEPTPTTRKINLFILGALVIIAIGLGIILNWAFASEDVLELKKDPIPSRVLGDESNNTLGVVFLDLDYCKKSSAEGQIRTSFVSETREVFLPMNQERAQKGCNKAELPVLIPKDLAPDTYRVRLRSIYNINPLKQGIVEEFYSKPFTIDSKGTN
jgi:hypothetical protein